MPRGPDVGGVVHAHPESWSMPHRDRRGRIASSTTRADRSSAASRITTTSASSGRERWAIVWRERLRRRHRDHDARSWHHHGLRRRAHGGPSRRCSLEESASLQLRMLAAAGGDGARIRAYTQDEARILGRTSLVPRSLRARGDYHANRVT
jgi:hypothetical protein